MDPEIQFLTDSGIMSAAQALAARVRGDSEDGQGFSRHFRTDAGEVLGYARAIEHIQAGAYRRDYPEFKYRQFFPVLEGVPWYANKTTYRKVDRFGAAKIVDNMAADFPRVELTGAESSSPIVTIANSYSYNMLDIARAAAFGESLDSLLADAAREFCERKADAVAAFGDTATLVPGFYRNSNITPIAATGVWSGLTPVQIQSDVNRALKKRFDDSKGTLTTARMLCGTSTYSLLMTTPYVSTGFTGATLGQWLISNTPWLTGIDHWPQADLANAGGTGERLAFYDPDPRRIALVMPQDFKQEAPQARNLAIVTNCTMRFGGVQNRYDYQVVYMDGAT